MDFVWLRLFLAVAVVVAHFQALTGDVQWSFGLSSLVAVQAFFVISGWIVTSSYRLSTDAGAFYVRRVARLYPLYAIVIVLQAVGVVALYGLDATRGGDVERYLAANLAFANFAQPSLLGFLADAPVHAINPSLWTLKIEMLFYLSVPLCVWISNRWGVYGLVAMFVASTIFFYAVTPLSIEFGKQLPGQLRFFVMGMVCERLNASGFLGKWPRPLAVALGLPALFLAQHFDSSLPASGLQPFFVTLFIVAGYRALPNAGALPDISYGTYLLHAPLIQFGRSLGWIAPTLQGLLSAMLATLLMSWVVSMVVEQPAIRLGRRLSNRWAAMRARHKGNAVAVLEAQRPSL